MNPLTEREKDAVATLCLMAALADGSKSDEERAQIKDVSRHMGGGDLTAVYYKTVAHETPLAEVAGRLESPKAKMLAYEMALCVCEADGHLQREERTFLDGLRAALELAPDSTRGVEAQADALIAVPLASAAQAALPAPVDEAGADRMILNYAILNGALELLPQSLATMAIIPSQMKMVYRVGKQYNYRLDSGHIKELLAAAGLGATSQTLENVARKFLGGVAKRWLGGTVSNVAKGATGALLSFAATYAIGQVAKAYYSGGRKLSAVDLKAMFSRFSAQGQTLFAQHKGEIETRARTLNVTELLPLLKGQ